MNFFGSVTCGALRDLVPFVQFKNCEKHPWRSVNFSKVVMQRTTYFDEILGEVWMPEIKVSRRMKNTFYK